MALGFVPLAHALGYLLVWQLYGVALAEGSAFVFFTIAQVASLPRIVPPEALAQANAFNEASGSVATLIGPGLGGFIIGLGRTPISGASLGFLVDSLSYLVSVVTLGFIRAPFQHGRTVPERRSLRREVVEGLIFLWNRQRLRSLAILGFATGLLVMPTDLAVIVLARHDLDLGARLMGLIFSSGGLGALVRAVVASWIRGHLRFGLIIIGAMAVEALGTALAAVALSWLMLALAMALVAMMLPIYNVSAVTYRLSLIPDELLGRVNSVFRLMPLSGQPVGMALVGLLLSSLGARPVLWLIAAGFGLVAITVGTTQLRDA